MKHQQHSGHSTADSVRRLLFGSRVLQHGNFSSVLVQKGLSAENGSLASEEEEAGRKLCSCLSHLEQICIGPSFDEFGDQYAPAKPSALAFNSDIGRMLYTISILLMFSLVILLLMIRSIRRSRSTMEVETLLDAMRFREELDLQMRQKKRLRKAKNKVTAWLCRGNGAKLWQSSPQILLPSQPPIIRTNSVQSSGSFIPEIVISEHLPPPPSAGLDPADLFINRGMERQNSCTPSLSLIYDFSSRKNSSSLEQEDSENGRLSQSSALSGSEPREADARMKLPEAASRGKPNGVGAK